MYVENTAMHSAIELHEAYVRGDLAAVRRLLDDPADFPNCRGVGTAGEVPLEYAIYWSSLAFVKELLEMGANTNYDDHAGFPSLIAALSAERRTDKLDLLELLLAHGANIQQRGHNDWTPLHWAAAHNDVKSVAFLLSRGADLNARTRIDNYETPLDEAERAGHQEVAAILRQAGRGNAKG
jgi:ankyrin repeat protein